MQSGSLINNIVIVLLTCLKLFPFIYLKTFDHLGGSHHPKNYEYN